MADEQDKATTAATATTSTLKSPKADNPNPKVLGEGTPNPDVKANAERTARVNETNAAARTADNTARRAADRPRMPTGKEIRELRKARFGDRPGAVQIDADPASGKTSVVYVDGDGKEVGRETFRPNKGA